MFELGHIRQAAEPTPTLLQDQVPLSQRRQPPLFKAQVSRFQHRGTISGDSNAQGPVFVMLSLAKPSPAHSPARPSPISRQRYRKCLVNKWHFVNVVIPFGTSTCLIGQMSSNPNQFVSSANDSGNLTERTRASGGEGGKPPL
ncbi:hypothetical protein S40288_11328 [Stachybotrys chartarum IBT 40288]|nr:hypothetical protein S40288_11328 [Stachybotrys chartarum IBT 40288]